MTDLLIAVALLGLIGLTFFLIASVILRNLLYICGPNEVLVFSGSRRTGASGRDLGYRVVRGGRSIRIPLLESVDRVDLTNMAIEVHVTNAYSKGGIPLSVQGVAYVKVASHEPVLDQALERLLHYDRSRLMQVAKETLEGNLRGVLARLTPEQVNEDKLMFAEKLQEEAEHDLQRLGLLLDTLKVQNVTDEKGYLNSIGRVQSAELLKRSRIAETEAKAKSISRDAGNKERSRVAELESEANIAQAEAQRKIAETLSRREALIAEEVGKVRQLVARSEAALKVQEARVEQVRRQLEADVIAPAQADMEAKLSEAKARASKVLEDGKATAMVLDEMITTWKAGGAASRDIFLLQKLSSTMKGALSTIQNIRVSRLTVLPPDHANGGAGGGARKALSVSEEIRGATGVDLPRLVEGLASRVGS